MGSIRFATVVFFFFSFAFGEVNCNADSIVITPTIGTAIGCAEIVVYCVFRPKRTDQGLDTWEIDANQKGYCVNRNAWKERGGGLYSPSYLNDLSCPLSIESLAIVQSMTETNLLPSDCNVNVTETRPTSAKVVFRNPLAYRTVFADSADQFANTLLDCAERANQNQNRIEESCLTNVTALFLNASSNITEEINCDATQNAIGFRFQLSNNVALKGSPSHPLCGGAEWEIALTRALPINFVSPAVFSPGKDCEVFYDSQPCNLPGGGLIQLVPGSDTRITITGAEQELGEFEVIVKGFFDDFSGKSFAVELLYDGEVIVHVEVENVSSADDSEYIPFVVVPSKGIYKIVNEFRTSRP